MGWEGSGRAENTKKPGHLKNDEGKKRKTKTGSTLPRNRRPSNLNNLGIKGGKNPSLGQAAYKGVRGGHAS